MSNRNDVRGKIMEIVNAYPEKWISSREIEKITGFWRQSINYAIRTLQEEGEIKVKRVPEKSYEMNYISKKCEDGAYE